MARRLLTAAVATAVAALALAAAACGGDDDSSPALTPGTAAPTAQRTPTPQSATDAAIAAFRNFDVPRELVDGQALGKADAKVVVAVYEDFQCPFCLRFTITNEMTIIEEYVKTGKVRFEFHHFPILGQESVQAAVAAQCAAAQGRFWQFHKKLFLVQAESGQLTTEKLNVGRFSEANLRAYAAEAGIDATAFDSCYRNPETADKVTADARQARYAGLPGTPAFIINGKALASSPDSAAAWRRILDDALAGR